MATKKKAAKAKKNIIRKSAKAKSLTRKKKPYRTVKFANIGGKNSRISLAEITKTIREFLPLEKELKKKRT